MLIIRVSGEKEPDFVIEGDVKIIQQEIKYPIDEKTGEVDYNNPYYEVEIEVNGEILNLGDKTYGQL